MEEIKLHPSGPAQVPSPSTTAQTLPARSLPPLHPKSKKRPLDNSNAYAQNFKMRSVLKDIRPHFIEVLKTADFRNSKAAHEIREGIKLILELHKQMSPAETHFVKKPKNAAEDLLGMQEPQCDVKLGDKSLENPYLSNAAAEKADVLLSGAYIVGGSAFGWNFITFTGKEPVYYGVAKEVYREKNPTFSSTES